MLRVTSLSASVLLGIVCFLSLGLFASTTTAQESIPSQVSQDWTVGYSLVLVSAEDARAFGSVRDAIQGTGARVAVAFPPGVILGWVPPELTSTVSALPGVKGVFTEPVPEAMLAGMDEATVTHVRFFNSVVSGQLKREEEEARAQRETEEMRGEAEFTPLINDAWDCPPLNLDAYLENLRSVGYGADKGAKELSGLNSALATLGTSDNMIGTVAVTLFFVESDGSIDPDTYTWTTAAVTATVNNATSGLSWWSNKAAGYGKALSFTIYYYPGTDVRCQTGYEPILHSSSYAQSWVSEIMASFGYSSGSHLDRVRAYDAWAKSHYGTDWAYSAFIEYNPSPASDRFTDGYSAWAYFGGYVNALYRSFGWPFNNLFSHESGHIFWACDEYYEAGYGGCTSCGVCSHGIDNANCEYCNSQSVACMMRSEYTDTLLCAFTPGQVGWLDGPIVKHYSHIISDPTGNGNGTVDPGESVTMPVTLKNWGLPVTNVSATLSTTDSYITISNNHSTYSDMALGARATSNTSYAFTASASTPAAHVVTFTLTIIGTDYDTTTTFTIQVGVAPILLVDDDGGASYESYYKAALDAGGYS